VGIPEAGWIWSLVRQTVLVNDAGACPGLTGVSSTTSGPLWCPPADVYSAGDSWWITLALPGVNRTSLEFEVREGVLHIRATRDAPWRKAPGNLQRLEIPYGRFERSFTLPDPAATIVAAELIDGCLHIELANRS
jgi:HSP20 family protein